MKARSLDEQILYIICSVFDAYSAALFLPDESGSSNVLAASFSLGDDIPGGCRIIPGKDLVGIIVQSRQPLMITDLDPARHSPGYYTPGGGQGIQSFMGTPIPTGGALCVDSKRKYSFAEKDLKILQLFAELVARQQSLAQSDGAGFIPRYFAELGVIQDLRFRYKRWAPFLKNYLRTISEATEFEYCALATLQDSGEYYCLEAESVPLLLTNGQIFRKPYTTGLTGWVFQHEQEILEEDGKYSHSAALFGKVPDMPEFPAIICMPVLVNKNCRGVLCLANTEKRPIDEALRSFVRQAVDHLSLFLENLYLRSRLRNSMPKAELQPRGYAPNSDNSPASLQDGNNPPA